MKRKFFAYPYIVWMILFIVAPMLFILYYAVNVGGEWTVTKAWATLSDAGKWNILWTSVVMALKTTLICLLLGYPIAYILSNMKKTVAGFLSVLFFVPMWMNFVLRTYAWQAILEYFLPNLLGMKDGTLTGTEAAVLMVLVYNFLPFMIMPLYNTLAKLDKSLLEAARDLGANAFTTFRKVVLPLSVPGIVSGITMVFMPAVTSFAISTLLSNGKLRLAGDLIDYIFNQSSNPNRWNIGSSFSLMMLVLILISIGFLRKVDPDSEGGGMW